MADFINNNKNALLKLIDMLFAIIKGMLANGSLDF